MVARESTARDEDGPEFTPDMMKAGLRKQLDPGAVAQFSLACPNAVSTPAHLPQQLALAQALENAAAALHGTSRDGQYDRHFLRLKSLIKKATPGEIREARAAITTRHIEYADRLLRREFDVW